MEFFFAIIALACLWRAILDTCRFLGAKPSAPLEIEEKETKDKINEGFENLMCYGLEGSERIG